jgi:hypothetical protein
MNKHKGEKMDKNEIVEQDVIDLNEFLNDIDILDSLDKYIKEINFFEITGMTNKEIHHSFFLEFLFDPNTFKQENIYFTKLFLKEVFEKNKDYSELSNLEKSDFTTYKVEREYKNIDLLISSEKEQVVIAIENKVDSGLHDDQLNRYYKTIEHDFEGYNKKFIFLTKKKENPNDENWIPADYNMIVSALEKVLDNLGEGELQIIIKHYINHLRRNILMNDNELKKICEDIYNKHKKALKLIYKQIDINGVQQYYDFIVSKLENLASKKVIIFDKKFSNRSTIRFTTSKLEELLPRNERKFSWNGYGAMYEIKINKDEILFWFTASSNTDEDVLEFIKRIGKKQRGTFTRLIECKLYDFTEDSDETDDYDSIIKKLDKKIDKIFDKNIDKF